MNRVGLYFFSFRIGMPFPPKKKTAAGRLGHNEEPGLPARPLYFAVSVAVVKEYAKGKL